MKIFTDLVSAADSYAKKESFCLNSICPYSHASKYCGNWCALFYFNKGDEHTSPYVILGCKTSERVLYVEEIVED